MTDNSEAQKLVYRRLQSELKPGQPIQLSEPVEITDATEPSALNAAMVLPPCAPTGTRVRN
jgi:hypothetical protein